MRWGRRRKEGRNDRLVDWWSLTHLAFPFAFGLFLSPFWALALMILWEPFEILVLSPLVARLGITFGYETLENSMVDVVFDVVGVLLGAFVARPLLGTPLVS